MPGSSWEGTIDERYWINADLLWLRQKEFIENDIIENGKRNILIDTMKGFWKTTTLIYLAIKIAHLKNEKVLFIFHNPDNIRPLFIKVINVVSWLLKGIEDFRCSGSSLGIYVRFNESSRSTGKVHFLYLKKLDGVDWFFCNKKHIPSPVTKEFLNEKYSTILVDEIQTIPEEIASVLPIEKTIATSESEFVKNPESPEYLHLNMVDLQKYLSGEYCKFKK